MPSPKYPLMVLSVIRTHFVIYDLARRGPFVPVCQTFGWNERRYAFCLNVEHKCIRYPSGHWKFWGIYYISPFTRFIYSYNNIVRIPLSKNIQDIVDVHFKTFLSLSAFVSILQLSNLVYVTVFTHLKKRTTCLPSYFLLVCGSRIISL